MGHERNSFLPLSKQWRQVVAAIGEVGNTPDALPELAQRTLHQVRRRLDALERDTGFQAAFGFVVALCTHRLGDDRSATAPAIDLRPNPSPMELAKLLNAWVDANLGSLEYAELAKRSAADAIAFWTIQQSRQEKLFTSHCTASEIWDEAGKGAAFSEISRVFFAKLLERYLKYFLDREASAQFDTIEARDQFARNLAGHTDSVARHAFEAARITQSFAAGWFNKHARAAPPEDEATRGFISFALGKLRQELLREAIG